MAYFSLPLLSLGLTRFTSELVSIHLVTRGPSRDGVLNEAGAEVYLSLDQF